MDASRFDALARALVSTGSRRGLLRFLTGLPLGGGLAALLTADEVDAHGRRRRRVKRHKHGRGRRRKHHKTKCKANSTAKTCAGTCGLVKNTCHKTVDCGSCACDPPCAVCLTCQDGANTPGVCVPNPDTAGDVCGESGQICQADGACACDPSSCSNPIPLCVGGTCLACGAASECQAAGLGDLCCGGACVTGICCDDSACPAAGAPACVGHTCVCAANGNAPCPAGQTCCDDGCADLPTDTEHCGSCGTACAGGQVCQGGVCGVVCGGDFCPAATEICDGGACQACDVCPTCTRTTVQAAIDAASSGDTIRLCAGTYPRSGTNRIAAIDSKNLTLIGAGAGSGGTLLDGGGVASGEPVLSCGQTTTELRQLTVTGANGQSGIVIFSQATLTLTGVTVTGNADPFDEGGGIFNQGALTLNAGTSVTGNTAGSEGGGIYSNGSGTTLTMNAGASVTGNTAGTSGGGIYNAAGAVTLHAGSQVTGNTAGIDGGGIYNNSGVVTLDVGSDVSGNFAPPGTPNDCVNVGSGTGCP